LTTALFLNRKNVGLKKFALIPAFSPRRRGIAPSFSLYFRGWFNPQRNSSYCLIGVKTGGCFFNFLNSAQVATVSKRLGDVQ